MYLGIDAGSISFKIVISSGKDSHRETVFHNGEPVSVFRNIIREKKLEPYLKNAIINGRYGAILSNLYQIPLAEPVKTILSNSRNRNNINNIIDIGSSKLCLIEIRDGRFHRLNTNSLCASGTGAFLDQQMKRMGITYESLNKISFQENPPSIATRCAVFAKSDLIHRQQEGFSVEMLWNGLAKGMAESAFSTLFRGKNINGDLMLIGGLSHNNIFIEYLSRLMLPNKLHVFPDAVYYQAESNMKFRMINKNYNSYSILYSPKKETEKPLLFENSSQRDHFWEIDEFNNEVDIYNLKKGQSARVFIGADIGSTSTKLVAMDSEGNVLFGLYTRTGGKPIEAFKNLLRGIIRIRDNYELDLDIKGMGTTGSGRKLVGTFAGADIIVNEITAHLKGGLKEFPGVKTIFEIGGQDSKYISVEDGWMKDANMNYVCAAGTGSFIEEQAGNLQISLDEIEEICHGVRPPVSSDRCTVFMEQDSTQLLINGFTRNEVMASMLYSVCKNYLNRVVHSRPIVEPVLFVGATAKNKGLVRAFENILGKKIHTSIYGHIMGAIGIAEMLRNDPPSATKFRGFDMYRANVRLTESNCSLCINKCRITSMELEMEMEVEVESSAEKISWGYMCGKEPGSVTAKKMTSLRHIKRLEAIQFPKAIDHADHDRIFFPKALQYYSHFAFWKRFFEQIGINLISSENSDDRIAALSRSYSISDFCYPLKLSIGHVLRLYHEKNLPIFLPYHIQDIKNPKTEKSHFCPISQSLPSIIKNTLEYNNINIDGNRLLSPVIDFEEDRGYNSENIYKVLYPVFKKKRSRKEIRKAFDSALIYHKSILSNKYTEGRTIIQEHRSSGKKSIAVMGRPYNIFDRVLNLDLLTSIGNYGYDVIPDDLLPVKRKDLNYDFSDIYWAYGQKLLACAEFIRKEPGMFGIYLTNFSCGPDSFLLSNIERIMGGKPFLVLELDELGGDAGYITRLEAFFDRIKNYIEPSVNTVESFSAKIDTVSSINGHRVFIPPMHPIATRLMCSAFRAFSVDAFPMIKEDMHTYNIGRSVVRGSECMPAASTIGSFLYYLNSDKSCAEGKNLLFMPCTSGPCRFGQYARLHHNIIKSSNLDASVFSPSSEDNYGDLSGRLRMHLLKSVVISDLMTKLGCAVRPYEKECGDTDKILESYISVFSEAIESRKKLVPVLKSLRDDLLSVRTYKNQQKPLIGIVGEIYVRNSPFSNSYLIENIEKNGGEAWLCSTLEWLHYTGYLEKINNKNKNKGIKSYFKNSLSALYLDHIEHSYFSIFRNILSHRTEPNISDVLKSGQEYVPLEFTGETILTIGRGIHFIKQGADMIVNVAPFSCMPGSISSAIFRNISAKYKIPIISMFYDGETDFNDLLSTYINNIN